MHLADHGVAVKTSVDVPFRYVFEEFMDHVRAMKTVRTWQYTQRFGHLGVSQDSRANSARVLEYFADSYTEQKEAVHKAGLFLSIYDYIGRNALYFSRKGLVDQSEDGMLSVAPALLRSVHLVFTLSSKSPSVSAKKLVNLARCFEELEPEL
jgi:hypothetical protein